MSELGTYVDTRTLRFERELPGTLEQVWSFLIEGDKLALWLAPGEIEPRIGGRVVIHHAGGPPVRGMVTAWNPPRELAYTWSEDSTNSEVSFELAETASGVRLLLIHHRLPLADNNFGWGWHASLDALALAVDGAEPARIRSALEGGQVSKDAYATALAAVEAEKGKRSPADDLREVFSASAFNRHMGFELVDISQERLSIRIQTKPELIGGKGVLHGGVIAAAIDTLGAFHAAISAQRHLGRAAKEPRPDKRPFRVSALDHHVDYLRPLTARSFMAASSVLTVGDNFVRVRAEVTSDEGELVAVASINLVY
jgi:uncharacterized protein (TIGR00369 family)